MNFKAGDKVVVLRDLKRIVPERREEGFLPYASKGEVGAIEEVFKNENQSWPSQTKRGHRWYAKVRIGKTLKTFRLTSIAKIKEK